MNAVDPFDPDHYRPWLACLRADDLSHAPAGSRQRAVAHDIHGHVGVIVLVDDDARELITIDAVHDGSEWQVSGLGIAGIDPDRLAPPPHGLRKLGGGGGWGIKHGDYRFLVARAAAEIRGVRLVTSDGSTERPLRADGFLVVLTVPGEPITYLQGIDQHGNNRGESLLL